MRLLKLLVLPAIAAGFVTIAACQVNPVTGESELILVSYDDEKQMGDEATEEILVQLGGEYPDPAIKSYVAGVGNKVASAARDHIKKAGRDFPDWQFHFYVVNDSMVNAFALPGGHVFVTRGILEQMGSESELAGLLGHESGHVFLRHGARSQSQQLLIMLPVALGAALLSGDEDTAWIAGVSALAAQFLLLKYSRDHESEADRWGMDFSVNAKYEAEGIINLMRTLEKQGGGGTPEFLSTHPSPENRVKTLSALKTKQYATATVANGYYDNKPQFAGAIASFAPTKGAYALADEGDALSAKANEMTDLASAKPTFRQALAKYQAAIAAAPTHAVLYRKAGETQVILEDFAGASNSLAKARSIDGTDFYEDFLYGVCLSRTGKHAEALVALDASLAKAPANPAALQHAGESAAALNQKSRARDYYLKWFELYDEADKEREEPAKRIEKLGYPNPIPPAKPKPAAPAKTDPKAKADPKADPKAKPSKSGAGEDERLAALRRPGRLPKPGEPGVVTIVWGDRKSLYANLSAERPTAAPDRPNHAVSQPTEK
jgi:predicted Zn-dependent protease